MLMHLIYIIGVVILGTVFKVALYDLQTLIVLAIYSIVTTIAFVSIYLAVTMNISNKSTGAIVSIVLSLVMIVASTYIDTKLSEPEYLTTTYMNENGTLKHVQGDKNPNYLDGNTRKVFEVAYDCLPACQSSQYLKYGCDELANKANFPIYSTVLVIITTMIGLFIFGKKDLK